MRPTALFLLGIATAAGVVALRRPASGQTDAAAAPIYGVKIPAGYRDWTLISVAKVGGPLNDLRAKLGNDVAIRAFREGKIPFPDGTIIARLAWKQVTPGESDEAIRGILERRSSPEALQKILTESSIAGSATNVQFMVKDSIKYASSGGWGFAQFTDGKPDGEAVHNACFPCHAPAKNRDFVFTRYSR